MIQQPKKYILLCLAGMTPQIITETLYALTQKRGERVDEIRVITTLEGRNKVLANLLDKEKGRFYEFCRDYGIDPGTIKFDEETITILRKPDGSNLSDIRDVEENICAGDQICEIVRELAKDPDTSIHASAAGGRKTMSIYLTAAMQLFGRVQDRLSHVLVSEQFETHPQFFYKPPVPRELLVRDHATGKQAPVSTSVAEVYLADIPFIRLRGVMAEWLKRGGLRYSDYVQRAQEDLQLLEQANDVRIILKENRVFIGGRSARLRRREFFIYSLYAWYRKMGKGEGGFVEPEGVTEEDLDAVVRMLTKAKGDECGLESCTSFPGFSFVPSLVRELRGTSPEDRSALRQDFRVIMARISKSFDAAQLPPRYLLDYSAERGSSRYGLSVEPERIIWS